MDKKILTGGLLATTFLFSACGGGGGGSNDDNGTPTSSFTATASWQVALPANGQAICYDFDTKTEVAGCSGNAWDLKLSNSGGLGSLWTNSGTSGNGSGGSLGGPSTDYDNWTRATRGPDDAQDIPAQAWIVDSVNSVFTGNNGIGSAVFEYALGNDNNLIWPSYRTFLLTTDSSRNHVSNNADGTRVFALQIINYYGGGSGTASGYITFRFAERTDASNWGAIQQETEVNATSYSAWTYYNLVNKQVVSSPSGNNWHIAFQRYYAKLNSGNVGTGGAMGGFLAYTSPTLYPGGSANVAALQAATANGTLADLTTSSMVTPANAGQWVQDKFSSPLSPAPTGTAPALDYGWYTLNANNIATARADKATMLRSGQGNSYARLRVANIAYADALDANSQQTWTINFDIQPAP